MVGLGMVDGCFSLLMEAWEHRCLKFDAGSIANHQHRPLPPAPVGALLSLQHHFIAATGAQAQQLQLPRRAQLDPLVQLPQQVLRPPLVQLAQLDR